MKALPYPSEPIVAGEAIYNLVQEALLAEPSPISREALFLIFRLTDFTSLHATDSADKGRLLAERVLLLQEKVPVLPPLGGMCLPGEAFQPAVDLLRESQTRISTVVNFPLGQSPLSAVCEEVRVRLHEGVDEIDLVFPLARYLANEKAEPLTEFIFEVKKLCLPFQVRLKTIIQSDEIERMCQVSPESLPLKCSGAEKAIQMIERLSVIAFSGGSDMVKTSTGKGLGKGASVFSAAVIASVAKYFKERTSYCDLFQQEPGIKYSGGVGDVATAVRYLRLHESVLGKESLNVDQFRFGASKLLNDVFRHLLSANSEVADALKREGVQEDYLSGAEPHHHSVASPPGVY